VKHPLGTAPETYNVG